jgi:hypothetical protein
LTRRAGEPFDEGQVEDFVQARANGSSVKVSAGHAGIGYDAAKTLEGSPEVRERLRELRAGTQTLTTVSAAWICEQLKVNVERARDCEQYKSSNEALKLLYEIVTKDSSVLSGIGHALPAGADEMRSELRRRLSASTQEPAIVVTQSVPIDDGKVH